MDEYKIYEDGLMYVFLMKKGVAEGHVKIIPKKGIRFIEELPGNEISHFFRVASKIASGIFEGIGAQGTNIIVNNGFKEHFEIDIIPRSEGDGLDFQWKMDRASPEELEKVETEMKQHTEYIGITSQEALPQKEIQTQKIEPQINEKESDNEPEEEDYRIRQLNRGV